MRFFDGTTACGGLAKTSPPASQTPKIPKISAPTPSGTVGRVSATLRLHAAETASTEHAGDTCFLDVVERTLCQARAAQSTWATRTLLDRLRILKTLRQKIAANPRNLAADVSRLKLSETLAAEVLPLLDACRFLEIEAPRILRENLIGTRARPMWLWGTRVTLRPEPLGVVLIIGPANYPLMLPGIQILQAVSAGNAVLIKPGTNGTAAIQTLVDLAAASGLPADLIQILPEDPLVAVTAMRCGVDKVFLTGAVTTGRAVRRELADAGTPAVMELSGCDAVFILDDADPELASDCLLFGLTLNQSQTCMAPRRVFASDQMVDRVLLLVQKKIAAREGIETIVRGEAARTAIEKIQDAVTAGAKLQSGQINFSSGSPELRGVVVLDEVTIEMAVTRSDLFAPVLSFLRVRSEEQALRDHLKCPYALSATVFGSQARSLVFARKIHAGCVVINDMIVPTADPRVPFGGRGQSGHGMTRGEAGLLEMTQLKTIVSTRRWFKPHLQTPTPVDADVLEQLIRIEHAAGVWQMLTAVPQMIKTTLAQLKFRKTLGERKP